MSSFRFAFRAPPSLLSVEDYRRAAERRLPRMVFTYVDGGADDLVTVRDNRAAFARWALRTRVATGHEPRRYATSVAGVSLDLPILFGPTGFSGITHWRGDVAAARAAEQCGTRYVLSVGSSWTIEEVADASNEQHFFQLNPRPGDFTADLMRRAQEAGYRALFVTVDVPVVGSRQDATKLGWSVPPTLTLYGALDAARRPRWIYDFVRHGRASPARSLDTGGGGIKTAVESGEAYRSKMVSTMTWDDIAWMREQWPGPCYVKGILDPDDARQAIQLGYDGVVVSNHGGRQLDFTPASLDALAAIVAAVGDRAEVLLDGGIRRGTDVIKALALGASAVLVARPYLYGLAAHGEEGAVGVLDCLEGEMKRAMTMMGVVSIADLDRTWLVPRAT